MVQLLLPLWADKNHVKVMHLKKKWSWFGPSYLIPVELTFCHPHNFLPSFFGCGHKKGRVLRTWRSINALQWVHVVEEFGPPFILICWG